MIIFKCGKCGKLEKQPNINGCKCKSKIWQAVDSNDLRQQALKIINN